MKRILSIVLIGLVFILPVVAAFGVVTYDENKSISRNQVDALIALANATGAEISLNNVLFVDGDRTDSYTEDGSMAAPYKTIAAAKAASVSGDVIIVAPGAYAETVTLTAGTTLFGWNVSGATLTGKYILLNAGNLTLNDSGIIINEDSADMDFRVESNGNANAIVVNAGDDRVGIFTAAPTVPLDVTGNVLITGDSSLDGGLIVNESSADKDFRVESDNDTQALGVDAGQDAVKLGAWVDYEYVDMSADYSIASTGKAAVFFANYTGGGNVHLMTNIVVSGRQFKIVDKGGNSGSSNITIDTEGSEKINGSDTATLATNYKQLNCICDGVNFYCY